MKQINILALVLLLVGIPVLCSCSQDELLAPEAADNTAALTIAVTDDGYTSSSGASSSRAAEDLDNYRTTFIDGDQIGLFAVKDDAILPGINNLRLTAKMVAATGAGSTSITWQDDNGNGPVYIPGVTYYAYYPYRDGIKGTPNNTNKEATAFFANVINDWTPATNQGTYADYTAQDLMIAKGNFIVSGSSKTLSLSMTHQMALVVMDLPKTNNRLSTDVTYTWKTDAPGTKFNGFVPCRMSGYTYRYLVNPKSSATLLSGSYTADSTTKEWNFTTNGSAAGSYRIITVDEAKVVATKDYTLRSGDFYMKDGGLISKYEKLSDAQKADCLGIVMKVGRANENYFNDIDDYYQKDGTPIENVHGYVMALHDGNKSITVRWCLEALSEVRVVKNDATATVCGYSNTQAIKQYATDNSLDLSSAFPAAYHASVGYELQYPSPINSSGWFFLSWHQLEYWKKNPQSMVNSGGDKLTAFYWTSTEYNQDCAYIVHIGQIPTLNSKKGGTEAHIRSCLVF